MAEFARGINELDVNRLKLDTRSAGMHSLPKHQRALLGSNASTLNHDVIVLDDSIVGETAQWSDVLFGEVVVSSGVVLRAANFALADTVDPLVGFCAVMVSPLTRARDRPT